MCLSTVHSKAETKKLLKNRKNTFVVWKAMEKRDGTYWPWLYDFPGRIHFRAGINIAPNGPGFHSFLRQKDAIAWAHHPDDVVVRCLVNKAWTKDIGTQQHGKDFYPAVVTSKIICPKYVGE